VKTCIGHVLRQESSLHDIIEVRILGKTTRGKNFYKC